MYSVRITYMYMYVHGLLVTKLCAWYVYTYVRTSTDCYRLNCVYAGFASLLVHCMCTESRFT